MSFFNNFSFLKGTSSDSSSKLTLFKAFLTILPLGQLWARVFWLDGSLDKMWLLFPFFLMIPFSIVPAFAMYFGYVKKGPGGKPYDVYMWIPIICKFLLASLIPMFLQLFYDDDDEPSQTKIFLYIFIFQIFIGMIPNLIRTYKLCPNLTVSSFAKAFIDSTMSNGIGELLPFILNWLPFIGFALKIIRWIPVVNTQVSNILWSICFSFGYIFVNMFNGNNLNKYCNIDFLGRDSKDIIGFVFILILTLFIKGFNEFSPI